MEAAVDGDTVDDCVVSLPALQNKIRKDPAAYESQFLLQYNHFVTNLDVLKLNPSKPSKSFCELIIFITQTSTSYSPFSRGVTKNGHNSRGNRKCLRASLISSKSIRSDGGCLTSRLGQYSKKVVEALSSFLFDNGESAHPMTRKTMVNALILLRNRNQVECDSLLALWFHLFGIGDKHLRMQLTIHIVRDVAKNRRDRSQEAQKKLKDFFFTQLHSHHVYASRLAMTVLAELYRRCIWTDAHTVNAMAASVLIPDKKICIAGATFLMGFRAAASETVDSSDDEPAEESKDPSAPIRSKKTRAKVKKLSRMKTSTHRSLAKKERKMIEKESSINFTAIDVLYDAQSLAEQLLTRVSSHKDPFSVRVVLMNLIARLVGRHHLILINFYSYLLRYLNPRQRHVTQILAMFAQACHELVPPNELEACIKVIMNNFVSDNQTTATITIGINSIREIASRAPLCLTSEMLLDLSEYRTYKDKGVMMAARSLLNLFREIYPRLLHKRLRGKHSCQLVSSKHDNLPIYGERKAATCIEGAELLNEIGREHSTDDESSEAVSSDGESESEESEAGGVEENAKTEYEVDETNQVSDSSSAENDPRTAVATSICTEKLAIFATSERIWTNEDHNRLKSLQKAAQAGEPASKRPAIEPPNDEEITDTNSENEARTDIVDPATLAQKFSREHRSKEQKRRSVIIGRRDGKTAAMREKGVQLHGQHGKGLTHSQPNNVKSRNKPLMMKKQSRLANHSRNQNASLKVNLLRRHIKKLKKKTGGKVRRRRM